ncbi:MAG: phosphate ABC transporter permease PstA [Frankiaceae bacterium]|nr:phosphate ABC transporter permease PstA [Frankiaceae bacterium]MBV9869957.1 phosphate ABC transporter permease PstA [Frankiaceae bacterium]
MTLLSPPPMPGTSGTGVNPSHPDGADDQPRTVGRLTQDDIASLVAAFVGSLALTWLVYFQLLPLSGKVGFLFCWYAAFLAVYGLVSSFGNPRPVVVDRLWGAAVAGAAGVVFFAVLSVAIYTLVKGEGAWIHGNFWTHDMAGVGPTETLTHGGITHAVAGSLIELAIATAVSLPLGIGTAIYMVEIGGRFSTVVRTVVEAMTALPDILAGLFIYTVLQLGLGFQRNGFCAAMALSIMMLPIIARSADVSLRVVAGGLREASLALGASRWATVWRVVLPTARSGLATAVILGLARAVGETAPVLITSGASTFFNTNPLKNPMNSLPLFIFSSVRSGEPTYITRGFGAASVLLVLVVVLFIAARLLSREKTKR